VAATGKSGEGLSESSRQPPATSAEKSRTNLICDVLRAAAVVVFFLTVAWLLHQPYIRAHLFDLQGIRQRIAGAGSQGILVFIAGAALANAMGVPRIWVSTVAGTLFGPVRGVIFALTATQLGGSIDFVIGRVVLRGVVQRQMPAKAQRWYDLLNRHGFKAILYLRMFPLSSTLLTSILGGVSQLSYWKYFGASLLGSLPFSIIFAILGSSAAEKNYLQLALASLIFVAVVLAQWLWSRSHKPFDNAATDRDARKRDHA